MTTSLFTPIKLGAIDLPNRIVMAPLTRSRAVEDHTPNEVMAEYYVQRATAGLIISEATQVADNSIGYFDTPGIHEPKHVAGWRKVTDAVHAAGGRIFLQLWHVGRAAHPSLQGGKPNVAPSAIAIDGYAHTPNGKEPHAVPHALTVPEIKEIVEQYRRGARNAKEAGFDGVEIHAANGYLIDEFLRDGTNKRTDEYGGSVENRARFLLEVTEAVVGEWGGDRVGVRLSPTHAFNDMFDSDPKTTFTFVATQLNRFGLAYLHVLEPDGKNPHIPVTHEEFVTSAIREVYDGVLMLNAGYNFQTGTQAVVEGRGDLVAYGSLYISNPDLVERFRVGAPLTPPDVSTFYSYKHDIREGYTDYPVYSPATAVAAR